MKDNIMKKLIKYSNIGHGIKNNNNFNYNIGDFLHLHAAGDCHENTYLSKEEYGELI